MEPFQNLSSLITLIILSICSCDVFSQRLTVPTTPPPTTRNLLDPDTRVSQAPSLSQYTYRRTAVLNQTQGFIVTWESFKNSSTITFDITAPLRGRNGNRNNAVVFGLSKKGNVQGSDVVVISVGRNGQLSIWDMHGIDNSTIWIDNKQSWNITGNLARIQNGMISVTISRSLDTCDEQDIHINNDMVHLIYGTIQGNIFVSNTTRALPFTPDGSSRQYLLDPVLLTSPTGEDDTKTFRISRKMQVPARRTSYWCSIHKGPKLQKKHHIIGFTPYFDSDFTRRHIHHQVVYRCIAPPIFDASLVFERFVNHPGEECYLEHTHQIPSMYCSEMVSTHALGGEGFVFPDPVGLALGEAPNEYFMLESHYDNPDERSDLIFDTGMDFHYTSRVSGVLGLHMVPPHSTDFPQIGQCSPECTKEMIPASGMHVFGAKLHAHTYTQKMRTKHYRGNQELPYITADENYDFSFQQIRHISPAPLVLPGDRLAVECIMDTSLRNTTLFNGFSTQDEMCVTFLIVNRRVPYLYCSSEYPTQRAMERFGIQNMTWHRELQERIVNKASNPSHVGQTLASVVRGYEWTPERRAELRQNQYYGVHDSVCPPVRRLAYIAYAFQFLERITGGAFTPPQAMDDNRPSTRTVSTPKGRIFNFHPTTQMPRDVRRYNPPVPCTS